MQNKYSFFFSPNKKNLQILTLFYIQNKKPKTKLLKKLFIVPLIFTIMWLTLGLAP